MKKIIALALGFISFACIADEGLEDLSNYRKYGDTLASSGQPTAEHLKILADQGVERIVYLAYTDNTNALDAADRKTLDLDMEYIHIPVHFDEPTLADFQYLEAVMQAFPDKNTLIHCQVNARASAFSFLYRTAVLKEPVGAAMTDMQTVWQPFGAWYDWVEIVAKHYDVDLNCEGCNWPETAPPMPEH